MTTDQLLALAHAAIADEQRGTPGPWVALPDQYAPGDAFLADANNVPLGYDAANMEIAAASRTREPQLARAVVALVELLAKAEAWREEDCSFRDNDGACSDHPGVRRWCAACALHAAIADARAALAGMGGG